MIERPSLEERLRAAGLPEPSAGLRDDVLTAAVPVVRATARATWVDRAWYSRGWRLATAAVVFALLVVDHVSVVRPVDGAPGQVAMQTSRAAGDAARDAGLPADQANVLARRALMAASRPSRRDLPGTVPEALSLEQR